MKSGIFKANYCRSRKLISNRNLTTVTTESDQLNPLMLVFKFLPSEFHYIKNKKTKQDHLQSHSATCLAIKQLISFSGHEGLYLHYVFLVLPESLLQVNCVPKHSFWNILILQPYQTLAKFLWGFICQEEFITATFQHPALFVPCTLTAWVMKAFKYQLL